MRALTCLSLAVLVGCASSSAPPKTTPTRVETVRLGGGVAGTAALSIMPSAGGYETTVLFTPSAVWRALPVAYDSLSLPITRRDSAAGVIATENIKIRRVLGKTRLSQYLDCGTTQIDPNADSYEIHLSVVTSVRPHPTQGSTILTHIDALARPIAFPGEWFRCTSKGKLESRLLHLVHWRLQP